MKISAYAPRYEKDILTAIGKDPDWDMFTRDTAIDAYKKALGNDVTYVCHSGSDFCGYVRALLDPGFALYISELFVVPEWRNRNIGHALLEQFRADFPDLTVYALSDEDLYYEKKGYQKIGSVFQL